MKIFKNKKNLLKWGLVIIFIIAFVFLFRGKQDHASNLEVNNIKYVKIAGQVLKVDLALTPETQSLGLSGRNILKEDEGMLFIFEKSALYYFWMKDMNFPIDMIWIDENLQVIYVKKNAQPESFPETFGSTKKSRYVLEVVAGFSEKNNLKERDRIEFLP